MVIKTKSVFEPAKEEDGVRVLITRYYPRGVKKTHFDYWLQELSPSRNLLFDYKEKRITWSQFENNLLAEIRENKDSLDAIYALHHQGKFFGDVTLLCYEKTGNPCHRHLIRDIIDDPKLLSCRFESHTGLPERQTPAEAAKIDLNLNPQNRLKDLIAKSAEQKEIAEGKFAIHLVKRVQYVEIVNEKDCVKVKPKGWMDKQLWKEINDILRVHQFAWLSNGKDSCWIKMMNS